MYFWVSSLFWSPLVIFGFFSCSFLGCPLGFWGLLMDFFGSPLSFLGELSLGFLGSFGGLLVVLGIFSWTLRVPSHFFGFFSHLSIPHFPPPPSTLPIHSCPPQNLHSPTRPEFPVIHQIVALDQIPGQAKNWPLCCHLHVSNLHPPGNHIQGTEGRDPHPLQPEF